MTELSLTMVAVTSAVAYVAGRRHLGLSTKGLVSAMTWTVECVGTALVFFFVNTALTALTVLGVRAATGRFVSLYMTAEVSSALLALLQAFVFQAWRTGARPPAG
jgi:hypothetical protein